MVTGFDGGINSAILRYVGAPEGDTDTDMDPSTRPLRETDLHPLGHGKGATGFPWQGDADVVLSLFHEFDASLLRYKIILQLQLSDCSGIQHPFHLHGVHRHFH
jgi:iron transport multicopper oxidase